MSSTGVADLSGGGGGSTFTMHCATEWITITISFLWKFKLDNMFRLLPYPNLFFYLEKYIVNMLLFILLLIVRGYFFAFIIS